MSAFGCSSATDSGDNPSADTPASAPKEGAERARDRDEPRSEPPAGLSGRPDAPNYEFVHRDDLEGLDFSRAVVADNLTHQFRGYFRDGRVAVTPRSGLDDASARWVFGMESTAIGREGTLESMTSAKAHRQSDRFEYRRGAVTEWYINDERGIEQGFDVTQRPGGDGPLRIELSIDGTLEPKLAGERAVNLHTHTGEHVLRYGGLEVFDADGADLDAHFEVADGAIAILVDDRQARYPIVVDPWIERKQLLDSDGDSYDGFGASVAVSGDIAVVGVPDDGDNGTSSGSVFLFAKDEGGTDNWGEIKELSASDAASGHRFGSAVAISGDSVIVGAPNHDHLGVNTGAVYVFSKDQGGTDNWGEVKKHYASNAFAYQGFGTSVAISGGQAIVGAPAPGFGSSDPGAAYILGENHGGTDNWGEVKKLTASDGVADDAFGTSVSISGNMAIAGAMYHADNGSSSGSAYLFAKNQGGPDNWGEVEELLASDGAASHLFGRSVAISDDTALIGATGHDADGSNAGAAYLFSQDHGGTNNWGEVKRVSGSSTDAFDAFGYSVSVTATKAVVGAHKNSETAHDAGAAYLFLRHHGGVDNWGESKEFLASNGFSSDEFGTSVAISGLVTIIGAVNKDYIWTDQGAAYLFDVSNTGPDAIDDTATTPEDSPVTIDVLANDSDPDGDTLTIDSVGQPSNGTVSHTVSKITYTPDANYFGSDSFTYDIDDQMGGSDTATVDVVVDPVNDAPIAEDDQVGVDEDGSVVVDVLNNDIDVDGDTLTIDSVTQPSNGSVTNNGTNATYTPEADYHGDDSFSYTISDGNGETDSATVSVTVNPINDAPIAEDDEVTVDEDETVSIDVLANDSDIDGDALSVSIETGPTNGSAIVNDDETIGYTPEADYNGTDSLTYEIDDGQGGGDTAVVAINVEPVNDAPVFVDPTPQDGATLTAQEGETLDISLAAEDVDADPLDYEVSPVPQGASFDSSTGDLSWTPTWEDAGEHQLSVRVSDGELDDTRNITIEVSFIDDDEDGLPDTWEEESGLDATTPDSDGDGISDSDEVGDDLDNPRDTDNDGAIDALDDDSDDDGIPDSEEAGDDDLSSPPVDTDGDGTPDYRSTDADGDGVADGEDNCRLIQNTEQHDLDADGIGDQCDDDLDGDGVTNASDNCPEVSNEDQADRDDDGVGDACTDDEQDSDASANSGSEDGCSVAANGPSGAAVPVVFLLGLLALRARRIWPKR